MSITTMLTLMVSSMLIYAAPLISQVSEEFSPNVVELLTLVLKESWSWVPFLELFLTLNLLKIWVALTPWLALLVGGLVGAIFSLIHAVATVHFRADHVVSGTVLNLMAPALAVFLVKVLYNKGQTDNFNANFWTFLISLFWLISQLSEISSSSQQVYLVT